MARRFRLWKLFCRTLKERMKSDKLIVTERGGDIT